MVDKLKKIWMNGTLVNWDDAKVHVLSHAIHYGTSVFEGVRSYELADGGRGVFRLKEHTKRLFESAKILMIKLPYTEDQINDAILETLRANEVKGAYIRPIAFIGDGAMGLYAVNNPVIVSISCWVWGAYLGDEGIRNGIRAKISSYARMHVNTHMTKSKAGGNYINSILAKREVSLAGYEEAIMLDTDGFVSECSGENIYLVKDGVIKTPPLTAVLNGITRNSVIQLAKEEGIPVVEARFTRDELYCADEVFMSGTAAELTPIREIDDREIGKPGPVTRKIQEQYKKAVTGALPKFQNWVTRF